MSDSNFYVITGTYDGILFKTGLRLHCIERDADGLRHLFITIHSSTQAQAHYASK